VAHLVERRERGRHVGAPHGERGRRPGELRGEELVRRPRGEWRLAGEHLVRHAAEGVEVGAVVGRGVAGRLLGRHVGGRAEARAHLCERAPGRRRLGGDERLGDAEVGDHGRVAGEQDLPARCAAGIPVLAREVAAGRSSGP
jgi:hypothetical protein